MSFYQSFYSMSQLIKALKASDVLKTEYISDVLTKVDRKYFSSHNPYDDSPAPIGYNATISAPHIHACSLEILSEKLIEKNCKSLDVGCGSGYLTVCMSLMNQSSGTVVGIEHIPELATLSRTNIIRAGYGELIDSRKIIIIEGDGRLGCEGEAPYDVIHVGAAAKSVPEDLIKQLKEDGIMLIPIGGDYDQEFKLIRKNKDGSLKISKIWDVRFVPLTDKNKQI